MRSPGFAAMPVLRRATLVVTLAGLLGACSANDSTDGATTPGAGGSSGTSGGGPGAGGAAGSAGSSAVGTGGGGAGGTGTGGVGGGYGTGGLGGTGGSGAGGTAGSGDVGAGGTAGSAGSGAAGTAGSGGVGGSGGGVNAVCNPIAAGMSTVIVNGSPRTFSVQLPRDTSRMALLFVWHGWNQVPTDFVNTIVYDVPARKWVPFDPNAFPMPLMIVTPTSTKLLPPAGLDWDIVSGAKDFPFFEAMLRCIQQQFTIEKNRIYSFGFSAGAVFTNLLSAKYPQLFAATISESGAWFNDQTQWSDVSIPLIQWQWPQFNPADRGNVLLSHGGPNDYATVISLESTNKKALPFLYNNGRTVMECAHTFGHTLDPDLTQSMYYEYMWRHELGGPPLSGMIPGFPTQAKPVGATACTFHPHP